MNLMNIACLDLEGVLFPEIWINFAKKVGIPALEKTTRDEPDYNRLMEYRLDILRRHKLTILDIQAVIAELDLLEGASEFIIKLREIMQIVILSDTFVQFVAPVMKKLHYPVLLCNDLVVENDYIIRCAMRQKEGKLAAVRAFRSLNLTIIAAGDSYNDIQMLLAAHKGAFFNAPTSIQKEYPNLPAYQNYDDLLSFFKEA